MTRPLTPDHFATAMRMAAEIYNAPIGADGIVMLYRTLIQQAPTMTCELFDWALQRSLCTSRFMPRLVDILQACYEPDAKGLPKLPDIDPRYANEHQQGIYYRAVDHRNKLLANAPVDTTRPKAACQRLAALPESTGHTTMTLTDAKAMDGAFRLDAPSRFDALRAARASAGY